MKKCVKCGRRYDDSLLVCEVCDLYLIKDVASEAKSNSNELNEEKHSQSLPVEKDSTQTVNRRSTARRSRVVTEEEGEPIRSDPSANHPNRNVRPNRSAVFSDSDEDSIPPIHNDTSRQGRRRRRRSHPFGRRLLPILRIAVPIILIIVAAYFIIDNWAIIREFLRSCLVGALIGGALITFLSLRSGRYFNPDAVLFGALGGALVGCIIKYNVLGTTVRLTELIYAIIPCVIVCVGIWLLLRSVFRR